MDESEGYKKRAALCGSLNFTGTKASCANANFALFAAYVYSYCLEINEPTASCMTV